MLRWPVRLASAIAASVLAYGWGDFASDPTATGVIVLGIFTVILGIALVRLYRPGGLAAFTFDDDEEDADAPVRAERPRRREPVVVAAAPAPAPAPAPRREAEPPRARRAEPKGPLWSGRAAPTRRASSARTAGPSAPPASPAAPDAVDLNAATADELAMLPGIGRGAAARVIAHRDARGPFGSVAELAEVEGFDAARASRVAGRLRV